MTNPVPTHAPKTDTPATCKWCGAAIIFEEGAWRCWTHGEDCPENPSGHAPRPDEQALLLVVAEAEGTNWTEDRIREAFNCAGTAIIRDSQIVGIAHRLALKGLQAESTLAAERASRLQADTELMRGKLVALDLVASMFEAGIFKGRWTSQQVGRSLREIHDVAAKPSVSPEQEKP